MAKWTQSQLDAINAAGGTVLVSAAAGSGKTSVLVERIISKLTDETKPLSADRLLVVTFTKAAAAEMRGRIEEAVLKAIKERPDDLRLRKQQLLLAKADICTVDSYCSRISREFFYQLGIRSDFRIMDDKQKEDLQQQAMEEALAILFEDPQPALAGVFSSERSDKGLSDAAMTLYNFTRSHLFPDKWLRETAEGYNISEDTKVFDTKWGEAVYDYAMENLKASAQLLRDSIDLVREDPTLFDKLAPAFTEDLAMVMRLIESLDSKNWNTFSDKISAVAFGRFPTVKGYKDDPLKNRVQSIRDSIKKTLAELSLMFDKDEDSVREDILRMYPLTQSLVELVQNFTAAYDRLKIEKNVADYSDIEHWAVELFIREEDGSIVYTDIARQVSERYDEIMIDEYQDTNEVQDYIFKAISHDDSNRFMVGDVKQSIYSFRQAMPDIFINYKNSFNKYDRDEKSFPASISLDRNFRSRPEVIDSVNYVFGMLMSPEMGGINYEDGESLVAGFDYKGKTGCETVVDFISKDTDTATEEAEAAHIADVIHELMDSGYTVTGKDGEERPLAYSDIAILMRSSNKYAFNYADELAKRGVPAWAAVTGGFFSAPEVQSVMAFLQVIDNPNQDIPLLSVLMGPFYGFTADDLASVRLKDRQNSIYVSIINSHDERFDKALRELEEYRLLAATMPSDTFISYLYRRTGCLDMARAMAGGESRVANLRRLRQYAGDYEQAGYVGVSGFVRFMEKLRLSKSDLEAANVISENADVVRIMSIHKSRGLEFPVCIIAGCGRRFVGERGDVALNSKLGFGVKLRDDRTGVKYPNIVRDSVILENEKNSASEELRIFYVAMTRAREKLIFVSTVQNPDKAMTKLCSMIGEGDKLPAFAVRSVSSIAQWLMYCALRHPSADNIRDRIGVDSTVISRNSFTPWNVRIIESLPEDARDREEEITEPEVDETLLASLKEKLAFRYPYEGINRIPAKVTASALAGEEESLILPRPSFMSGMGLTPAERGTALHAYMQFCDFEKAAADPEAELHRLVDNGYITPDQGKAVSLRGVRSFLDSRLGQRIRCSGTVFKEQRFTVNIPAYMLPDAPSEELGDTQVILQGAIDCWFEEDGKLYIIDFKTDAVKEMKELADRYTLQLLLYRKALEELIDKPVGGCYIYSLRLGDYIAVDQ